MSSPDFTVSELDDGRVSVTWKLDDTLRDGALLDPASSLRADLLELLARVQDGDI